MKEEIKLKERIGNLFSRKDLIKLLIPLVIEQILLVAVGMADTIMISSVGEEAVSGVSLVDTINVLIINIFTALATGGSVVAAQWLGHKERDKACVCAGQLVLFVGVLSLGVMALMLIGHQFILQVVFGQIEPQVMDNARTYLFITALSIPFIALYNAGAALFRAMRDSRTSMITSLIMNGINIAGNAVLIYGFHMGVEGAAIPTLASRVIAAGIILALLLQPKREISLKRQLSLRFQGKIIKKICYIGIPNSVENSLFQLGKILVLSLATSFGTTALAANAVSNNIALIQILPGMAIGLGMITVVAQCVGAGDYDGAKYYTKLLMKIAYVSMWLINLIVVLGLPLIVQAFNLSQQTAQLTSEIIIYHAICCALIWPLSFTLPNALRAANDVKVPMIISIVSMWVFRIGFSYMLAQGLQMGVFGIWVAMTIDWLFRGILFVIRYLRGKWQKFHILDAKSEHSAQDATSC